MENVFIVKSSAVFDGIQEKPYEAAILVRNGKIEKILSDETLEKEMEKGVPVHDYGNKMIMPSFVDAHTHMFTGAISASDYVCDTLGECKSEEECVQMILKFANNHKELKRIRGTGWFVGNWNDAPLPSKKSLDEAIPDRPVYLQCADSHSMWLNSKALEEAAIRPDETLENGVIETDEKGELTGMLIEPAAFEPAMRKYMEFSKEELLGIHRNFQEVLAQNGIAAVSEMFADDYSKDTYQRYNIIKEMDERGELNTQVFVYTELFGHTEFEPFFQMKEHFNSNHFHIAGVKGFIDGVTETYTGLLLEPYTDKPETCGENLPLWPQGRMQEEIIAANQAGIQVRLHCIADGSVRMALDMYEKAKEMTGRTDMRNTIEHIENIHPDDIGRFAELDVIPSMQPYHVTLSNGDKILRIGAQRCRYEWPIRSILEKGGQIAIGTDYPVVTLNPFQTIYAALTRCKENGEAVCQNPWETLSLPTVLKAYTANAAWVYHAEEHMGTMEAGKDADFIVLDKNLFEIKPEEILNTRVIANYFEGRLVWSESSKEA